MKRKTENYQSTLAQTHWRQLSLLILISPWVSSEFDKQSALYEKRDPWLNSRSLRYIATVWSGTGSHRRREVSPMLGDMRGLPQTYIFAGDFELFFPDLVQLSQLMNESGVEVTLIQKPGALHVYPLIPSPEGKEAIRQIVGILKD